jgi:radical SAM superfamily enzyme YgiQ (UPF0313 family)
MRFLLINVPIRLDQPPSNFPIGLAMIAAVLRDNGHPVEILDANAYRYSMDKVVDMVKASRADAVGISGLVSTYKYQLALVDALKQKAPSKTIILGGGCATSVPELLMSHSKADILVVGEGEHTIVELAQTLDAGHSLNKVKGIVYREADEVMFTEPRPLEPDLDRFPMPAYELFPVEIYLKHPVWNFKETAMTLISSRGCPMSCRFCYNIFGQRSYRRRGVESIVEEIRRLKRDFHVRTFGFVDDNVTINRLHLTLLCEALAKEDIQWGCHGRVDTADDERLSLMAASGCRWLGFGIESGSRRILDSMNKKVTVEEARDAILRTKAHGIFANTTFIWGYPGEDLDSIQETMRFQLSCDLTRDSFFATPYPGTELYKQTRERGLIQDEHAFVLQLNNASDFTINLTDLPDDVLLALKQQSLEELKTAVMLRNAPFSEDKVESVLELIRRFLEKDTLILETKAVVLLRLADYYTEIGDMGMALKTRSAAFRLGAAMLKCA